MSLHLFAPFATHSTLNLLENGRVARKRNIAPGKTLSYSYASDGVGFQIRNPLVSYKEWDRVFSDCVHEQKQMAVVGGIPSGHKERRCFTLGRIEGGAYLGLIAVCTEDIGKPGWLQWCGWPQHLQPPPEYFSIFGTWDGSVSTNNYSTPLKSHILQAMSQDSFIIELDTLTGATCFYYQSEALGPYLFLPGSNKAGNQLSWFFVAAVYDPGEEIIVDVIHKTLLKWKPILCK